MKKILLGLLLLVSNLTYSQKDSSSNNKTNLAYLINVPRPQIYYQTPYVNLNLRINTPSYGNVTVKSNFAVILFSGLAFTAASLLEAPYNYNNKNFWQQTPRQVILCMGVGLTFVGGYGLIKNTKF